jgi:hypothetical protein
MTLARLALAAIAAFTVGSCTAPGSSTAGSDPGANPDDAVPVGLATSTLKVVIPTHTVPPGDSFECYYTDVTTDREIYVNSATGKQGPGGHHITIYYATVPQAPGHHTCIDAEMAEWRQVGAAGDAKGDGVIDLPPGIAVKVPAGRQMVVQTHYINATAKARDVEDEITVHLLAREKVTRFAQGFAVVDGTFEIPPRATFGRTSTCTLTRDLELIMILGHMHERGRHYKLEHLDAKGALLETVLDQDWESSFTSHPPTKRWAPDKPFKLAVGEKLRQTCTWDNTADDKVLFPTEMCLAFSMHLDDDGFAECAAVPDAR